MVSQVQVVSILMIVHGGLVSILGVLYAVIGPVLFGISKADKSMRTEDQTPMMIMSGLYMGCGALVLAIGVLHVVAGIRCLKFRGRPLAMVAMFSNVLVLCTLYCAPTAIAIMIYGLIVFFNADVIEAFAMADRGRSPQEIRAAFESSRRYERYDDRDSEDDYERRRRVDEDPV